MLIYFIGNLNRTQHYEREEGEERGEEEREERKQTEKRKSSISKMFMEVRRIIK